MMKNISFLFAVGLFFAVLFVGCGDKAKDSSNDSAQSTATNESGFDFGALKSEAEAQNIDLSKIMLKDSPKDSAQNKDFAPQIAKSLAKFYLLEGNIDSQAVKLYETREDYDSKATLYLKISSAPDNAGENQSNAIAFITGKMVHNGATFAITGEVDSANLAQNLAQNAQDSSAVANQSNVANVANQLNQKTIRVEFVFDNEYAGASQFAEVRIAPNGEVSATFIGDDIFKNGTNAKFKNVQGKINEATIFGVSVAQKHKGKDFDGSTKDFDFNVATQIPLITSPTTINFALDKINSTLREIAMPELREYGEDSTNFSSVSTFNIDYIDEKIIVLGNYNYLYSGGAHGNYSDDAISFDLSSGEKLPNDADALLKDKNDPTMIKTLMLREALAKEYEGNVDENAELTRFRIRPNGVEFYWGIYEVAPYAVGIVSVRYDFKKLAPFVREDSPYYYLFANFVK